MFGTFCSEKEIESLMAEVDKSGNGKITFNDFKDIMVNFKKATSKIKACWSL